MSYKSFSSSELLNKRLPLLRRCVLFFSIFFFLPYCEYKLTLWMYTSGERACAASCPSDVRLQSHSKSFRISNTRAATRNSTGAWWSRFKVRQRSKWESCCPKVHRTCRPTCSSVYHKCFLRSGMTSISFFSFFFILTLATRN